MDFKNITIIGAGAIGAYVYHGLEPLDRAGEINVSFLAEGERRLALEQEGLSINGTVYHPAVHSLPDMPVPDLLIISVKYQALPGILNDIRTLCSDHTVVISLMNGIDSEEIISSVIPTEQIIYSLIRVSSQRIGRNITYNPASAFGIYSGEIPEQDQKEALEALQQLFSRTEIPFEICDDILKVQWHKFALNISANLPQAVLGVGTGAYEDSEHAAWMRDALAAEVLKTAEAYGIHIDHITYGRWKKNGRLSTLQDLDAHRKTEVDMFLGVLIAKAKEKGISVPYSEYTFHVIKALEEKNEGLFSY